MGEFFSVNSKCNKNNIGFVLNLNTIKTFHAMFDKVSLTDICITKGNSVKMKGCSKVRVTFILLMSSSPILKRISCARNIPDMKNTGFSQVFTESTFVKINLVNLIEQHTIDSVKLVFVLGKPVLRKCSISKGMGENSLRLLNMRSSILPEVYSNNISFHGLNTGNSAGRSGMVSRLILQNSSGNSGLQQGGVASHYLCQLEGFLRRHER